jgi:hypothetical protein
MELKVVCGCGQKYKFDVEPVNGRMPFAVNCPVCGVDGTVAANAILAGQLSAASPANRASTERFENQSFCASTAHDFG